MIHTVKDFCIINEAEVDVFLEFFSFLYDLTDGGNLISDTSAFSITSLYIWKFSIHVLLKPSLKDLSITLLACEVSGIIWQFESSLAFYFFGIRMKTNLFSTVTTAKFSKFADVFIAALYSIIFKDLK